MTRHAFIRCRRTGGYICCKKWRSFELTTFEDGYYLPVFLCRDHYGMFLRGEISLPGGETRQTIQQTISRALAGSASDRDKMLSYEQGKRHH